MNNNELRASLLMEAADLLGEDVMNEGAAARAAKNIRNSSESAEVKSIIAKFKSGKLDPSQATKLYNNAKNALDKMLKMIDEIPKETFIDKYIAMCNSMYRTNIVGFLLNGYGAFIGGDNLTKNVARKRVEIASKKLDKTYAKYQRKQALQEAVDLLYDKAVLCEDGEEASAYVEKAEELQKEIDEIPEEKPVEMDDYPADDVTGGAGAGYEDDQEAIKDLVYNDSHAEDLLTDDEGKSVTVDECADILFEAAMNCEDPDETARLLDLANSLY